MIRVAGVKRQFGSRVLFEGVSWMIPPGARLGLVGPNGAGKTTLLRILEGREQPDAGAVHRPSSLLVGYLPQEVETVESGSVLSVVLSGFAEAGRLEAELERLERQLAELDAADPRASKLTLRYGEARQRFEQIEGDRLEARAKTILAGLGVEARRFHEPLERLSGGWRMRVILARLLLGSPGLLLLDEPTNHLDLEAIAWLEEFLVTYEGAFVVVSHDRYFLNRMVRGIVELERGALTAYAGNYDAYLEEKRSREEALEQQAKQQEREVRKVERFIERFRYKNTKARQVQSRIKALERLERVEVARQEKKIRFGFPPAPRSGDVAVRADGVGKRYGTTVVYDGMDLLLRRGDRCALVGPNGAGKSTLLKLLAGRTSPDEGRIEAGHGVRTCYYAQHQLDDLDSESTLLEEIERAAPGHDRLSLRRLLGCFLFTADDVDKSVRVLSGGEKARLALAKLLIRPSNLLLLDEPTNHLDLRSREVLEDALDEYAGTLVVISHDRYFINRVATVIGEVGGGRVELLPGDYDEWVEWKRRRAAEAPVAAAAGETDPREAARQRPRDDRKEARRREAEERNRRYRAERAVRDRLRPLEARIAELEQSVRALELQQADPDVYADPSRAADVGRRKAQAESALRGLYEEWEALASSLETD
jgi:ATP-binding cassette subfamily F protein 3